ncbi:MAG: UDP-N-acetylglucosamine 2-epimerase (non-hydrolyzing) [Candidatus Pacebacteria bacterium]|jgi:UDP-N-acetylglucosamine 2-epimerase|nr:UDP-N-acetylglucosamine 2-epimerase (non-hydrolyzing) [Candidatus Paceibacterota bacterium]
MGDNKKKIAIVVGARPNFIKIAPLFWQWRNHPDFLPVLVHTGQHYDYEMSQVFFQDLEIPKPDYNLGIGSDTHARQTARMMEAIEEVLQKETPDIVAVVGDVNSTLAGALVAAKMHILVAHIEAGPRAFNRAMPEEINRLVADHVSDALFCPVRSSVANLEREGLGERAHNVGDLMYDSFRRGKRFADNSTIIEKTGLAKNTYLLVTIHRPQNVDDPAVLGRILGALANTGPAVFPVHPRTRAAMDKNKIRPAENIKLIDPVGYLDMMALQSGAKKIVTDSGGIQKEAYWTEVPCVTLLEENCWPETVAAGWNTLAGTDIGKMEKAIAAPVPQTRPGNEFGDGNAAGRITAMLEKMASAR